MSKLPAIAAAVMLVLIVSRCCLGADDWLFFGLDEQPVAKAVPVKKQQLMGVSGHIYSDGCWRADLQSPTVEQHDVELFRAINSRRWNAKLNRIEWTAPTWDGANGGWQPGEKSVEYTTEFRPKMRVLCNGTDPPTCRQVETWEF
jgi:hypothetical protein